MRFSKGPAVCLAVLFVAGCAGPPPPKKTVFDPLTQQVERARDVQNIVDQNSDQTRRAVDDKEEDGDSRP